MAWNAGHPKIGKSHMLKVGCLRTHPFITTVHWATRLEMFVDALTVDGFGSEKKAKYIVL